MKLEGKRAEGGQPKFLLAGLHVFVLFGFALAQPLYDLLSRNPEFFVSQRSQPEDIWLLVLGLSFLLPGIVVLALWGLGLFSRRVQEVCFGLVVTALVAATLLPAVKALEGVPGVAQASIAGLLGAALTLSYFRYRAVRLFLTALAPAVLLFPGLFLFHSAVHKLAFPQQGLAGAIFGSRSSTPVVLVVFDEFSMMSLLDENRQIDSQRYPNFAALARESTWFRNATTVSEDSHMALAAILTGRYPDRELLSTVQDYPNNLFTLLGGSHEVRGFESLTSLCPESICREVSPPPAFVPRLRALSMDLSAIYLHRILPADLTEGLPVVNQSWRDFWEQKETDAAASKAKESSSDRVRLFERFLASMSETGRPEFYFLHSMLPHVPWEYLPSGKRYTEAAWEVPGLDFAEERWGDDEWLVIHAYQRYLLQVGFVDTLLGKLVAHLKTTGLYDQALLIVTADHGISFQAGGWRRRTRGNEHEIMPTPLFVKAPHQREGKISERNVESIDILPTVADVLGAELPWPVDGASALDDSLPERGYKRLTDRFGDVDLRVEPPLPAKWTALERKLSLFGSGGEPGLLYEIGPHKEIVGQPVAMLGLTPKAEVRVEFDQPAILFEEYNPRSEFVPCQLTGRVYFRSDSPPVNLAIVVNGTVGAVTRTYGKRGPEAKFSALVSESSFRPGSNDVEAYVILPSAAGIVLAPTSGQTFLGYSLVASERQGTSRITSSRGESYPVRSGAVRGFVRVLEHDSGLAVLGGWAADLQRAEPVQSILIFVDGQSVFSGSPNINRPDVVGHYGKPALQKSGFAVSLPSSFFGPGTKHTVRVFGLSKRGIASELEYFNWSPWQTTRSEPSSMASWIGQRVESFAVETDEAVLGYLDGVSPDRIQARASEPPQPIAVSGWAAQRGADKQLKLIAIAVNGEMAAGTSICCDRPDVAKHFSNPGYLRSGWTASFSSQKLREGENVVTAYVVLDVGRKKLVRLEGTRTTIEVISH